MRYVLAFLILGVTCTHTVRASDVSESRDSLQKAAIAWKKSAPSSYTMTVRYSSMVGAYGCWEQTFTVKGTRSRQVSRPDCKNRKDKFGSVPALFRFGSQLLAKNPDQATLELDETYGYPKKLYVGSATLEDSYFMFEVLEFKPSNP
jgi:hypothetical protein